MSYVKDFLAWFDFELNDDYKAEIQKRNEFLLHALTCFGVVVCGLGTLTRIILRGGDLFFPFALSFAYFVLLYLFKQPLLRKLDGDSTTALYLAEIPAWVLGILMGTYLDPTNRAITFFLFLVTLPLFILDRPKNVMRYALLWVAAFALADVSTKSYDLVTKDLSFLVMFAAASLSTLMLLLATRLEAVRLFVDSEHRARTDATTGLKNRYALECEAPSYFGSELMVGLARVDDLSFFINSYGHEVGDAIVYAWGQAASEHYGAEHCYRYTAHAILIIVPHMSTDEFERLSRQTRESFLMRVSERRIQPDTSMGYVFGVPANQDDLNHMINHADVTLGEARHGGGTKLRGGAFDRNYAKPEEAAAHLGGILQSDYVDALTGLPNRQAFHTRGQNLLDFVEAEKGDVTLLFFDLENFKKYNEENGYQAGDDLLRNIARILRLAFPERLVARFSDDHFAVMCYSTEYEEGLAQALNATFDLHGHTGMPLKAGVYRYDDRDVPLSVACDRAKAACDSIKKRYDVFWRMYDDEIRVQEERRSHIINHIDDAIAKSWLRVYYQPIVSAATKEVVECEALVRWIDPEYGFMPPITFIGVLEQARLIHKIDLWMVEHVCADYRDRVRAGLPALPVSVNLSRLDFMLCDVYEELVSVTSAYDVPTHDLHVEVTESALSDDFGQLLQVTNRLRAAGFEIWLDDFGSDYSSLTTLKDFPCDVIKLDLMFLRTLDSNSRSRVIIQQIVELANRLGARSLAEGVEEPEHLAFLAEVGCDLAQGYLISKPEPLETLAEAGLV